MLFLHEDTKSKAALVWARVELFCDSLTFAGRSAVGKTAYDDAQAKTREHIKCSCDCPGLVK